MATTTAPGLYCCSSSARVSALAPGATISKSLQRTSVGISPARAWPSRISHHRLRVSAEYSGRRGGGAGDFVAGVLLGGAVFGALYYILAPHISKSFEEVDNLRDDIAESKRPLRFLEGDEDLEKTPQNLNEKIAQLNAAIDNVSAQLRNEEDFGTSNESAA
ncbi:hypothetical protein KC19_8G091800 [Ceratodon purpureus]|uniref:Uncharacterized protein n=1 Tax=Ceratodon purpureus TaxID=3225 RepID=A0A8T0H521_CERPU|nr:hypothetical protein KC19_8G091800 [Ceratodon purpureus]